MPDCSPGWWHITIRAFSSVHLPLLFFISGYLFSFRRPASYKTLVTGKFKRIAVPYLSASVIIILIKLLAGRFTDIANPVGPSAFLQMLYMPAAAAHLWFLWALWWMFLIAGLFRSRVSRAVLFLAALAASLLPFEATELFCLNEVKRYFVYFMAGCCTADGWFGWEPFLTRTKTVVPLVWLTCLVLYSLSGTENSVLTLSMGLLGTAAMLSLCKSATASASPAAAARITGLSRASYTVYLFHPVFIAPAVAFMTRIPWLDFTNQVHFAAVAIAAVAAGIVLPLIIHEFLLKRCSLTGTLFAVKQDR